MCSVELYFDNTIFLILIYVRNSYCYFCYQEQCLFWPYESTGLVFVHVQCKQLLYSEVFVVTEKCSSVNGVFVPQQILNLPLMS